MRHEKSTVDSLPKDSQIENLPCPNRRTNVVVKNVKIINEEISDEDRRPRHSGTNSFGTTTQDDISSITTFNRTSTLGGIGSTARKFRQLNRDCGRTMEFLHTHSDHNRV